MSKRKTKVYGGVLQKVVSEAAGVSLRTLTDLVMFETRNQMNSMIYDTPTSTYLRTGKLFESLTATPLGNNRVKISLEVPYSFHVHEGTRRMPPRPFLKAAIVKATRDFKKKDGLSSSTTSVGGKKVEAYDYD